MGDDTIAVQKVCDQKESVVLHRREKKLMVMLAADGRYGSRCMCVCVCVYCCMYLHNMFNITSKRLKKGRMLLGCMEMNHTE